MVHLLRDLVGGNFRDHRPQLAGGGKRSEVISIYGADLAIPAKCASTSNITAKSCSAKPIARAAVRNSFATAVEGKGTFVTRPSSRANNKSFCIISTSNQASAGI